MSTSGDDAVSFSVDENDPQKSALAFRMGLGSAHVYMSILPAVSPLAIYLVFLSTLLFLFRFASYAMLQRSVSLPSLRVYCYHTVSLHSGDR